MFMIIGAVFIALELWGAFAGGHSAPVLPPVFRIVGPIGLGAVAFLYAHAERYGFLLTALLMFLFFNREYVPNELVASGLVVAVCLGLIAIGYAARHTANRVRLRMLLFAFGAAVVTYVVFMWWFLQS